MHGEKTNLKSGDDAIDAGRSIATLLLQVVLAKATDLARIGRYSEAEGLLAEMRPEEKESPLALDLLARIRAQQGRLLEADSFWAQASRLNNENEAYQAGRRRIAKTQKRPMGSGLMFPLAIMITFIILVTIAGFMVKKYLNELKSEFARTASDVNLVSRVQHGKPLAIKPEISGISYRMEGNDGILVFHSGLFDGGANLKPEAKTLLSALSHQLEPYIGQISIVVVGHTNNIPMPPGQVYRDNFALGMARAVAVFEHLRQTAQLPSSIFYLCSAGEARPPYPNDKPNSRSLNQTVTLRLSEIRS